jgi:MFS family permease
VDGWLTVLVLEIRFLSAIIIFTLASLGCGLSQSLNQLLFFRVIQGIGGALLLPVGRLSLLKIIPRTQFWLAMSFMSLAGLLGLWLVQLGGWLVEVATWHWIFLINIPMGVLGILMTLKVMPNVKEPLKHLILGLCS